VLADDGFEDRGPFELLKRVYLVLILATVAIIVNQMNIIIPSLHPSIIASKSVFGRFEGRCTCFEKGFLRVLRGSKCGK